jgi:1-acyl-sn-glycerol-3-phosphate acyltransferase
MYNLDMMLLKILHTLLFYAAGIITFFVGLFLAIIISIFVRPSHKGFQAIAKIWAKSLLFLTGAKITVNGTGNVPLLEGVIFASNHQGALDVLIALAYMPRPFRFVAKKELFNVPLFGWYMRMAGYVPIEREVSTSAHRTMGGVADVLTGGGAILIYPEGTRSKTGELGAFKRGSMMAAFASGATVVPVAISGSYGMMPKGTYLMNPVPISVNIGHPISYKKYVGIRPTKKDYEVELDRLRNDIEALLRS